MHEEQARGQFVEELAQVLLKTRIGPRFWPDERFHHEIWSDEAAFLTTAISLAPFTKAQLFQDAWVMHELRYKRNGYFVEIGASDGVMSSNTYMLEKEFGWTGVLAEPHPVTGARLHANRSCYISNQCVSDVSGDWVDFALVEADPHLSTIQSYSTTDGHAETRRDAPTVKVETISLQDLLTKAEAPRNIDYLSIDTEGSELDILRNFDFNYYNISLISVEHNYTSQRLDLHDLLADKGYTRKLSSVSAWDDWYVRSAPGEASIVS